ncbi:MAG: hypothetical protein LBT40_03350 [Deltaproteobacteria bacterium]|jgi:hypothetical protein|nr:hypothetical protein [Deltaproteobacteria bacterium]
MTTIASLENDPERGSGWALLRLEVPPGDRSALSAAGDAPFSFSVKDAQSGEWLQRPRTRRVWSLKEHYFQAERRVTRPGELAVLIPPAVTERLVENLFFFSVKGAGLSYPDLMVQAGHILTASTPIILAPKPGQRDDDCAEEDDAPEDRLNASEEPPAVPRRLSGIPETGMDHGDPAETEDGYELPGPGECLGLPMAEPGDPIGYGAGGSHRAGQGGAPNVPGPGPGPGGGGEGVYAAPPLTETESYGVPESFADGGTGVVDGTGIALSPDTGSGPGGRALPKGADPGPGPFFPPEDLPEERPGFVSSSGVGDGPLTGLPAGPPFPEPFAEETGPRDHLPDRSAGPGRRLWLVPAALALAAALLYLFLWRDTSSPLEVPPPAAESRIPEPSPETASVPLEGCWAADGLSGAAPGAVRRPVTVQYCFSSPSRAELTVFDLDDGGRAEDSCTSSASVSVSPEGTLIAGDPGGPVCERAPDTSYYAMRLACQPRLGGEVDCLIETDGGAAPLEAVFTRR